MRVGLEDMDRYVEDVAEEAAACGGGCAFGMVDRFEPIGSGCGSE